MTDRLTVEKLRKCVEMMNQARIPERPLVVFWSFRTLRFMGYSPLQIQQMLRAGALVKPVRFR